MTSIGIMQLPFMLLAALAVGAVVYALMYPYFSDERQAEEGVAGLAGDCVHRRLLGLGCVCLTILQ